MFNRLRLRLTLLYLLSALLLTALIDGGVYVLLQSSFRASTDAALRRKVELGVLGFRPASSRPEPEGESAGEPGEYGSQPHANGAEEPFDAELAAVFLVPLDGQGNNISTAGGAAAPVPPDGEALQSASVSGEDLRTLVLRDGSRYRLLTEKVDTAAGAVYLQAGRSLADQEAILRRLLAGILGFSALITLVLGWGSWLLAGRSLIPAQQAWEKQQAFVANASHELRAPLTLLRASAEVAQRKLAPDSPGHPLLEEVLRETDAMAGLVEDLLLLSRLDAGALRLEMEPFDVAGLLREVSSSFERVAGDRGIRVEAALMPATAIGDRARIRQVILILLDNALRHVQRGGWIRVADGIDRGRVSITVADNGAGIPPEHLPHVFERFYRGDAGDPGGSGLGLSIARAILQAHHGEIELASQPDQGTRVTLRLPAPR